MKKSAFTLVESMICLLIISAVGMAAMVFSSAYLKTTFDRDAQTLAVISNINNIERVRAEVRNLSQLYSLIQDKDAKVTAVGIGEINLHPDGTFDVVGNETYMFSDNLKPNVAKLFRIEFGGNLPNSKMSTVVMLK